MTSLENYGMMWPITPILSLTWVKLNEICVVSSSGSVHKILNPLAPSHIFVEGNMSNI